MLSPETLVTASLLRPLFLGTTLVLGSLADITALAATTITLEPDTLKVRRGSSSAQSVDALALRDQSGRQDNWNNYVEFYPASNGMVAILNFEAPVDLVGQPLDKLKVSVNSRGPNKSEQYWRWQVRNAHTNRWELIGSNADAPDWVWDAQELIPSGNASNYVDELGRVRIRYLTSSSIDNSNVDAVSVALTLSEPVPVPVPVPVPPEEPGPPDTNPPTTDGGIWSPAPGTSWQWQLTGSIDTSLDVDMYDIDLFDAPQSDINTLKARGVAVICYFSAGSYEDWRTDAGMFPASVIGSDNGWEGEQWLDISDINSLAPVMRKRLDLAVSKGCDGVEPDNIDGFTNSTGFPLTAQDQINYNVWLAEEAHARGLSIGLKNDVDQVEQLEPYFDWALNEQCYQYSECETLLPFVEAGKAVFGVEYSGNTSAICSTTNALDFDWLIKSLDLDASRESCR